MKILIIENPSERSHEEAMKRGCNGVTQYWWSFNDQGVLIPDDDYSGLSQDEITSLVEYISPQEV